MNKTLIALALALAMTGSLTACSSDRDLNGSGDPGNGSGVNGSVSNGSASTGQVARRYDSRTDYARDYLNDGRYAAGTNGQVYGTGGGALSRDMTRDARNIVRDAGDAVGDVGRGVGNAIGDMTRGVGNAARDIGNGVSGAASEY